MENRVDKPLIGLLVIGIIGGVILYHHLSTNFFYLAALFWILVCYLWQNNEERDAPWYERMSAVFVSAILWSLTFVLWYAIGYGFNYLMNGHSSPPLMCFIEGAVMYLIGWQLYDIGLANRWWFNLKQYLYYLVILLSITVACVLVLKDILMH
jgi:hypothetical protein